MSLIARFACSTTWASSSLRRWLRSSRNSRCLRWKSFSRSAYSRCRRMRSASLSTAASRSIRSAMDFSRADMSCSSLSRPLNSRSSFCCEALAGAASRSRRSMFTNPIRRPSWATAVAEARMRQPANTMLENFISAFRRGGWGILAHAAAVAACPGTPRGRPSPTLEPGSDLELEPLRPVALLLVEGVADAELQRPEGRQPREADARRIAELARIDLPFREDVAAVHEEEGAEAAVVAGTGERHLELHAAHDLDLAAQRHVVDRVPARAERARFVAPDRADAAGVVVLERRVVVVAVGTPVAQVDIEREGVVLGHRQEVLVAVAEPVVARVAAGQR